MDVEATTGVEVGSPISSRWRATSHSTYRGSGIDWLGGVPVHWDIAPLYARYWLELGKMLDAKRITGDCLTPYLRNVDVQWDRINTEDLPEMDIEPHELSRFILRVGDLLVCEGGEVGRAAVWNGQLLRCGYQKALHRLRPRSSRDLPRFLYYALRHAASTGVFIARGNPNTIPHLTGEQLRVYRFPFPPLPEQRAIAAFLDRETSRIDALIAKKERLIELLQEKRTALISHAVTKGLDPKAPMKPGGRWVDESPAHWAITPLKRLVGTKITDGPHETPEILDEGIPFLSAEAIQNGRLNFDAKRGYISRELHQQYCRKCRPARDDVFLCKSGATTGKVAIVETDEEFSVWSPLAQIRAHPHRAVPRFLYLALHADYVQDQVRQLWSHGTQPNIAMGVIETLTLAMPPLSEQRAIVEHVEATGRHTQALGRKAVETIAMLREYRSALISAAVTGKIDVRGEGQRGRQ